MVDYLEAAIDAIFEVAVGIVLTEFGAVVVIGVEIGSLMATGSLVPGAIIAGGVPWLAGPAGIFVRALVTATNSDGRQLTEEEYAWANDMVFRGSLPPIDTFRITNYIGAGIVRSRSRPSADRPWSTSASSFNDLHPPDREDRDPRTHACLPDRPHQTSCSPHGDRHSAQERDKFTA